MFWRERVYCGDVSPFHQGKEVLLMGFVDAIRDHGNLLFVHLRDIRGTVQVVFDSRVSGESAAKSTNLKEEYVIRVRGKVALREPGTENPNIATGDVEVFAHEMEILSQSRNLPFQISEKAMVFGENVKSGQVDEELRLQYRYLDLRRPSMQDLFMKRYRIMKCIRDYLDGLSFLEVETPFLTKSTPEGARDYLVPSRIHQGKFYSLPQSPQLFKQLLMMSGMDRYFQIVKCFRDEDLRPNRQPEFTQLDLEASFIDEEFIYEVVEELTAKIFAVGGISLERPFLRMTYEEAMERYGSDRPDLRFDMAFRDLTDILSETQYGIFRQIIGQGGCIKGFCVKGKAALLSKNVLQNEYAVKIAPSFGARGMTWMKVVNGELESNVVQFFSDSEQSHLKSRFNVSEEDVIIMIADPSRDQVHKVLSSLRLHLAERLGMIPQDQYRPLWVTDFPLFELKDGKLASQHHPFTMPDRTDFDPMNKEEMVTLKSRAYDLVMNGEELGGGSIRIHQMGIQKKIFRALELTEDEIEAKFGFFLRALEFGAPPHGGLALGMDRVVAMILKAPSIREVIAFPKNRSAYCPLSQAPSLVDDSQLEELGLLKPALALRASDSKKGEETEERLPRPSERVDLNQVRHIAKLARLRMTEEEAISYQNDLNDILSYVEALGELDTEAVEPMHHVLEIKNVWREDRQVKSEKKESILSNAPSRDGDYYKVPRIIDG